LPDGPSARGPVVDDDPGVLRGWERILQPGSLICAGAFSNPVKAVREIPTLAPEVVLMDLRMPRLSGITATRLLSRLLPQARILIVTAVADLITVGRAFDAGAAGYLVKGECEPLLLEAISLALKRGVPLSHRVGHLLSAQMPWPKGFDRRLQSAKE
jgi:DNA-binding NarL/FixJ family response regulator